MPGRDGYAVAEYVKRSPELSKDIRVVLLTGAAEPVEEARSRDLGIDGVLSKPFEPHVATALVRRLLGETPTVPGFRAAESGAVADAPAADTLKTAAAPPPLPGGTPAAAGDAPGANAIAVDDYFRRLDEALATAGLATAPEPAGDLAAIAGPPGHAADRSVDAETMIMPRPASAAADVQPAADEPGEPKLVDAFSALLAAEEGDGGPMVAGPVEMEGAPAPSPAVQWTPGHTAGTPVEAVAETVALQAVAADAAEAVAEVSAPETAAVEATLPETASDESATVAVADEPSEPAPIAAAATAAAGASPAALRADASGHAALEGIDLDVFADAVAQKILHRLTDARIDAIVSERVLEIAERLVREEIDRIKADAQ
jgi:CheY-like chemotaxis protein